MQHIDARGLLCPEPVILAKKALSASPESVVIIVDNDTSKINVERFLKIAGYSVQVESSAEGEYSLTAILKP